MSFENTREVLGERATLDGLIDGTLEELKDNCSVTLTNSLIIPHNTGLKRIVLPNLIAAYGRQAFSSMDNRYADNTGYIPGAEIIVIGLTGPSNGYVFAHCENVTAIDAIFTSNNSNPLYIGLFEYCINLKSLIIRNTTRKNLGNTNAFNRTPFASGGTGGTLYVPQALISSYQSATNWSTILSYENNQVLPIEGSIYDGYYADGTPIE